MNKEYESLLAL